MVSLSNHSFYFNEPFDKLRANDYYWITNCIVQLALRVTGARVFASTPVYAITPARE